MSWVLALDPHSIQDAMSFLTAALAIFCLLMYLLYVLQVAKDKQQLEETQHQLSETRTQQATLSTERDLLAYENRLLRECVAASEVDHSIDLLLTELVPDIRSGFAVFLQSEGDQLRVKRCRGLTTASQQRLALDRELLSQCTRSGYLGIPREKLLSTRLFQGLDHEDRVPVQELWLFSWQASLGIPSAHPVSIAGATRIVVVTTRLPQANLDSQIPVPTSAHLCEMIARLLAVIGAQLLKTDKFVTQQEELALTREMLELRSITELSFETPVEMLSEILRRLAVLTHFERAAVYFPPSESGKEELIVRSAVADPASEAWLTAEARLAEGCRSHRETSVLGDHDLYPIVGNAPFQTAMIVPLGTDDMNLGLLTLTRHSPAPVHAEDRELVEWGAAHLLETLVRTVDRASMERRARRDGLTQLANRRSFDHEIARLLEFSLHLHEELSLIILDVDRFKSINDTYGHQAGDQALKKVAQTIDQVVSHLRVTDRPLTARIGGEEFAVLLPGVGLSGATRIAEAIREAVRLEEISLHREVIRVTISAGVAIAPACGKVPKELIDAADKALYSAKHAGRDCVRVAGVPEAPQS